MTKKRAHRHPGLGGPQARVKRRSNRTHVRFVAKNIRKPRALCDITELNAIPVHVCFAILNGVAQNIIGTISRSSMSWSLPS